MNERQRNKIIFFVSIMPNMIGITKSNIIRGILVAIGNLIFIIGIWMLARTWTSVVGLSFPGRLWAKRLIIGAAILVTLFLVVPSVIRGLQGSLSGNFGTWDLIVNMVSGLGDLIALSLIAPILLTALALRGGLLKWPWLFLTCILGSWLIYDGVHSWAPNLGLSPAEILGYANFFRVVACLYTVSAGLSQRFIMEGFHRQK